MGKNQHVTPHKDGGWQVKGEGNSKATIRTSTQREAIEAELREKLLAEMKGNVSQTKAEE